ncbi:MAG: phosphoglycerate kinase [Candidatus Kerfeldbacteria bacterium]|nr:phosphoglycerate kinase [Candidatus Kerfeldbacteria bacterium]
MPYRLISEISKPSGKTALVRLDTNVPMAGKKVVDDSRLQAALPTLRWLERRGAKIVIVGHLGRPAGKTVASLSLKPIGYLLGKLLRQPVKVLSLKVGAQAIRRAAAQAPVLLENIRFEAGEESNNTALANQLAQMADLYVNEAFSVSHRRAASLVGITSKLPSYAGFHLAAEVEALDKVRRHGKKSVVVIVGGAKVADKLPVIAKLLPRASAVLTGGAVANTFLAAKGYKVGQSLLDKKVVSTARALLRQAGKKIILPVDVIVDNTSTKPKEARWRKVSEIKANESIFDIGTKTTQLYAPYVKSAQTIFWSGTLGRAEQPQWRHATEALASVAAAHARGPAFVVVGGGDTVAFFHQKKMWVDHVSLAGGAMLAFLAGAKLPGLAALGYYARRRKSK